MNRTPRGVNQKPPKVRLQKFRVLHLHRKYHINRTLNVVHKHEFEVRFVLVYTVPVVDAICIKSSIGLMMVQKRNCRSQRVNYKLMNDKYTIKRAVQLRLTDGGCKNK